MYLGCKNVFGMYFEKREMRFFSFCRGFLGRKQKALTVLSCAFRFAIVLRLFSAHFSCVKAVTVTLNLLGVGGCGIT